MESRAAYTEAPPPPSPKTKRSTAVSAPSSHCGRCERAFFLRSVVFFYLLFNDNEFVFQHTAGCEWSSLTTRANNVIACGRAACGKVSNFTQLVLLRVCRCVRVPRSIQRLSALIGAGWNVNERVLIEFPIWKCNSILMTAGTLRQAPEEKNHGRIGRGDGRCRERENSGCRKITERKNW